MKVVTKLFDFIAFFLEPVSMSKLPAMDNVIKF